MSGRDRAAGELIDGHFRPAVRPWRHSHRRGATRPIRSGDFVCSATIGRVKYGADVKPRVQGHRASYMSTHGCRPMDAYDATGRRGARRTAAISGRRELTSSFSTRAWACPSTRREESRTPLSNCPRRVQPRGCDTRCPGARCIPPGPIRSSDQSPVPRLSGLWFGAVGPVVEHERETVHLLCRDFLAAGTSSSSFSSPHGTRGLPGLRRPDPLRGRVRSGSSGPGDLKCTTGCCNHGHRRRRRRRLAPRPRRPHQGCCIVSRPTRRSFCP